MNFSAAVLVTSDRAAAGIYEDKSGKILVDLLKEMGFEVKNYQVIADDYEQIKNKLIGYADEKISLILTSGGTGFSKRDFIVLRQFRKK